MNWGAWITTVFLISGVVTAFSFVSFLAYEQGRLEGFKQGLRKHLEIEEKYPK